MKNCTARCPRFESWDQAFAKLCRSLQDVGLISLLGKKSLTLVSSGKLRSFIPCLMQVRCRGIRGSDACQTVRCTSAPTYCLFGSLCLFQSGPRVSGRYIPSCCLTGTVLCESTVAPKCHPYFLAPICPTSTHSPQFLSKHVRPRGRTEIEHGRRKSLLRFLHHRWSFFIFSRRP